MIVLVGRNTDEGNRLLSVLPEANVDFARGRQVRQGWDPNVTLEVAVDPSIKNDEAPFYIGAEMLVQLMDRADAIITKPGGGTSAELAYRGLPALFDASAGMLHWE